ncbi:acsf [Bugula neritina]|uniref:Medium-chain acyl-CoA ligase ACSF2, mitochondrial n=1 Tax=Bugula neritina TaxID=10212 RepID=A0A7J7J1M9_BUGNE|nr:acsf [Bugula neritina]
MISYACIAWVLAGKVNKVVLTPDLVEEYGPGLFGNKCAKCLEPEKVEYLALPGTIEQLIVTSLRAVWDQISTNETFLNGAQIVSRQFKVNLMEIFQGIPFTGYGMCETFLIGITTLGDQPSDLELMLDARLYAKPNIEVRLVDDNNEIVDVGKDGEVQVKTYSIFKSYRGEKDKTRAAFTDDGFLRTGDMGMMYPDGTFIIKGRVADAMRFKVFGDVIYPGPIEEVVSKYPGVKDVSVVGAGVTDLVGDEIVYCIRLQHGVSQPTEEDLNAFCDENGMDESQRPARIIYFDSFPTTANARKVSKSLLREKVKTMVENDSKIGLTNWYIEILNEITR